eukprot:TRINITY_DN9904_c0_g1_i4.p1 TRINITY_DN9904_c0_g1~~TRINITY_DN9904_c0_g1_i4.p1  ORF type:complete len:288 (-),score=63.06 TRINITY_DN9904_c0_g1_i4:190-1053(-)
MCIRDRYMGRSLYFVRDSSLYVKSRFIKNSDYLKTLLRPSSGSQEEEESVDEGFVNEEDLDEEEREGNGIFNDQLMIKHNVRKTLEKPFFSPGATEPYSSDHWSDKNIPVSLPSPKRSPRRSPRRSPNRSFTKAEATRIQSNLRRTMITGILGNDIERFKENPRELLNLKRKLNREANEVLNEENFERAEDIEAEEDILVDHKLHEDVNDLGHEISRNGHINVLDNSLEYPLELNLGQDNNEREEQLEEWTEDMANSLHYLNLRIKSMKERDIFRLHSLKPSFSFLK